MDFSVSRALWLMARTAPCLGLRALVYLGMAVAYILVTGLGAGIGFGLGGFGGPDARLGGAFWGGAIGFGLIAGILYLLREYVLYAVKAGHLAVLVELMDNRPLPEGQGQVAYGTAVVRARFKETSVLFGIDQLAKGVIRAVTGLARGIADLIPLPGMDALATLIGAFLRIGVGFVDEVILAHAIRHRATDPWASAREALVLYAQNHGAMLRNAAVLALITYGLAFVVFLLLLAPAAALAFLMPGGCSAAGVLFALILAWGVKAALLEPLAIACMMQAFFAVTDGQAPDPAWDARLDSLSGKFRELKDRAANSLGTPIPVSPWVRS
ncbi:hypothetical protein [Roseomonas indoligenes]|uniref:Uncharacterized protein n=1 Tax=Roseomonas indoligenes TaxID=2820811 RepID=A0A940MZH0_9PROT|nr:hypothetical protein [Pararoseomonas indoligenes]MBP0493719.1 hypothetical protein [Pararoseomonas indoligenes]